MAKFCVFPLSLPNANKINEIIAPCGKYASKEQNFFRLGKSVGITCIKTDQQKVKEVWDYIQSEVIGREYVLGVRFDNPPKKARQ